MSAPWDAATPYDPSISQLANICWVGVTGLLYQSRRAHETGWRHKNNVTRHLRDVHRKQDFKARDNAKTKRMLEQVERAAVKQYGRDIKSGEHKQDSALIPIGSSNSYSGNDVQHSQGNHTTDDKAPKSTPAIQLEEEDDHTDGSGEQKTTKVDLDNELDNTELDPTLDGRAGDEALDEEGTTDPTADTGPYGAWTVVEPAPAPAPKKSDVEDSTGTHHKRQTFTKGQSGDPSSNTYVSANILDLDDDDDGFESKGFRFVQKKPAFDDWPTNVSDTQGPLLKAVDDNVDVEPAPSTSLFKKRKIAGSGRRNVLKRE
ncbi:hypothetical protein BASA50_003725 [Batrachochytrium salamandrivorans]|uniref:Matrin-type domain-containing protein n=1 Tax=Batrachochytrium salamandrivorans TaxID=1357716 RepID=A0ABQ8FL42_9FUNG|nr:hypothetical protein BASA61_009960 [Batrachochytrium salamandrivorans]KAH6598690.1 hypothetical protein BASA50_003725 [Batrachochytrium salamandrivorans]